MTGRKIHIEILGVKGSTYINTITLNYYILVVIKDYESAFDAVTLQR